MVGKKLNGVQYIDNTEVVKTHFDPKGDGYYYWVNRHKKSF